MPMIRQALLGAVLIMLNLACSSGPIVRKPVSTDGVEPLKLIRSNNENARKLKSVQAVGKFSLESPETANQASVQLAVDGGDSVYIKLEGFLGIDGVKAVFNRQNFLVYNIIKRYVVKGKTNSDAIGRVLDYAISYDEILELLYGVFVLSEKKLKQLDAFYAEDTYYVLQFEEETGRTRYWIDPFSDNAVSKIEIYNAKDEVVLLKEFTRFEKVGSIFLPRYIRMVRPQRKEYISLYFNRRQLNKKVNPKLFNIKYPSKIKVIEFE